MPAISTISDDFNDNVVANPPWVGNYGGAVEVGGRARTPTTTGFSGYQTDYIYSLDSIGYYVRAYPATANGAVTGEVYSAAWLNSFAQGAGNQIGFRVDTVAGTISFENQSGYFDAGKVTLTYDPVVHTYWLSQFVGANLVWSTSPDNFTWTVRRTLAAPGYVAACTDFRLFLESHRDLGVDNYAEWDNLNVLPAPVGITVPVTLGQPVVGPTVLDPVPVPTVATGSWWTLDSIARENLQNVRDAQQVPSACPNDGEPLISDPRTGRLRCPYDGWVSLR